jgi:hypothetical protein
MPDRYITRMDYAKSRGYWVRFKQRTALAVFRFFGDATYGGAANARGEALKLRNRLLACNPNDHYGQRPKPTIKLVWRQCGGWLYQVYRCEMQVNGRRLVKQFSVHQLGMREAERRAREWFRRLPTTHV